MATKTYGKADIDKAKKAASSLFPSATLAKGSTSNASGALKSVPRATKDAEKLFPDATTLGVYTPPPTPIDLNPNHNNYERVEIRITATGGTMSISYDGQTASGLAYNANAATIKSALEGLSTIGSGNIDVVQVLNLNGIAIVNVLIPKGTLANKNVKAFTVGAGSLTGGTATVAVTADSMEATIDRQTTREALAAQGLAKPAGTINDYQKWQQRTPKDIGDPNRIPGEDYDTYRPKP